MVAYQELLATAYISLRFYILYIYIYDIALRICEHNYVDDKATAELNAEERILEKKNAR